MTGLQLKNWARTVHDEAIVQLKSQYGSTWEQLDRERIRAELISTPIATIQDACNVEDAK